MINPLIRKLEHFVRLGADDRAVIEEIVTRRLRTVEAREDLVQEGDRPETIFLIIRGWGCRYKQLGDGRRQIMSFLIPGDFCDMGMQILSEMDHSIGSLTTL